jgi:hypothetical protein
MSQHLVHLIGGSDNETATVVTDERDHVCHITFQYRGRSISVSAADFFDALSQILIQLEPERLMLFCYGASLNVFPSGMSRSMGAGLKAYRLIMGRQTRSQDLVFIFDSGPDVIPSSVARQREYFDDWIASLKA